MPEFLGSIGRAIHKSEKISACGEDGGTTSDAVPGALRFMNTVKMPKKPVTFFSLKKSFKSLLPL
jgi:hypothetical protein